LPDEVCVHDYVTTGGRKIGKSLGNAVDPFDVVRTYGADALRWWLLREVPRSGDADFSEARLVETANRDLANGIGNLVQRVVGLGGRAHNVGRCQSRGGVRDAVDAAITAFDLRAATGAIVAAIDRVNREIETTRPWSLHGGQRAEAVDALAVTTAAIVDELAPFAPDLATRAAARLNGVDDASPVYARASG
jgi:methionyl-tRNA synthetase